ASPLGGARVAFTIPDERRKADDVPTPAPPSPATAHVLVLAREPQPLLRRIAAAAGDEFTVRGVSDVATAAALATQRAARCAVVVVSDDDAALDDVAALRKAAVDLAVVVMTSADDIDLGAAALRAGVEEALTDEVDGPRLRDAIRYAIQRKAVDAQLETEAR